MNRWIMQEIVEKFRLHSKDTSSADVQIGLLTEHIRVLMEEFQKTQGMKYRLEATKKLLQRRRLLDFLSKTDQKRFEIVTQKMKSYE